jgi:hypothetical protein
MRTLSFKCEFGFGSHLDLVLNSDRPSLISAYSCSGGGGGSKKLSYGPPTTFVLQPPSSGEESEDELPLPTNFQESSTNSSNKMTSQQIQEQNLQIQKRTENSFFIL